MESNHDKVFVTTFLGVIGFLVALTVGIVVIANMKTPMSCARSHMNVCRRGSHQSAR